MDLRQLRHDLEAFGNGNVRFSIIINSEDGVQRVMHCVAEIDDNGIDKIRTDEDGATCLEIDMIDLTLSHINKTDTCTEPILPDRGSLRFLTDVKLQLILGLSKNLPKDIEMTDDAQVGDSGGTVLSMFKLIRYGTMAYSNFGFLPKNWGNDYDIFLEELSTMEFGNLSEDIQESIRNKVGYDIDNSANVRAIMRTIRMEDDNKLSNDVVKDIFDYLIENSGFDDNTLEFDTLFDLELDPVEFARYRYGNYIVGFEIYDRDNDNGQSNNGSYMENNNNNGYGRNNNNNGYGRNNVNMENNNNNSNLGGGRRLRRRRTMKRKGKSKRHTKSKRKQTRRTKK